MTDYDAVVVGAGPGGSTAAYELASRGFKTLLVERQRSVALNIACAEGITDFWFKALNWEADPKWISSHVRTVRIYAPSGDFMESHVGHVGYVLERKIFDRNLAVRAGLAGAEIITSATFTKAQRNQDGTITVFFKKQSQEHQVKTRLVVGADGPSSVVAKQLGADVDIPRQDFHYTAQVNLVNENIGDWLGLFTGKDIAPYGYAWVFPKAKGFANVGVGVASLEEYIDPVPYLDEFLRRYFPENTSVGKVLSVVPTGGHKLRPYADGFVAVGDAARLADPLTGGGLGPAILSGTLAGRVAAQGLEKGDVSAEWLARYPEEYWKKADRKSYELSYALRESYFDFEDRDFNYLFKELKPLFHGKSLESVDSIYIGRTILSKAPGVAVLAAKKGKHALFKYLKATLFGR